MAQQALQEPKAQQELKVLLVLKVKEVLMDTKV
mgnify:CR=1 FL=1|jgi:hypothetical protein